MNTLREAARQGLEALRGYRREIDCHQPCDAERGLEAALEQPEQEPVAWVLQTVGQYHTGRFVADVETVRRLRDGESLYTHPPRREWRSLSEEEIQSIHDTYHRRMGPQEFARAIEAALRSKNHD